MNLLGPDGRPVASDPHAARLLAMQEQMLRDLERALFLPEGGRVLASDHQPPAPQYVGLSAIMKGATP